MTSKSGKKSGGKPPAKPKRPQAPRPAEPESEPPIKLPPPGYKVGKNH